MNADLPLDPRALAARDWAFTQLKLDQASFAPASADASFRRYFRIQHPERSWIVMDAPPAQENSEPFVRIAGLMLDAGLNAPRVVAQDLAQGFLLLSDLGRDTYLHVINAGNADRLYDDAIRALILWQGASQPGRLPDYDETLLRRELALFPGWYLQHHVKTMLTPSQAEALRSVEDLLVDSALAQPRVFVHRDYMPRNLMVSLPNPGVLDFQDAVYGPISYDVVCLFKDAFLSWPQARIDGWLRRYYEQAQAAGLPVDADYAEFRRALDWMGLQRHLKVLGIFARIQYRDGKPQYLADAPRFIGYVRETAGLYPEMKPLLNLFDQLGLRA